MYIIVLLIVRASLVLAILLSWIAGNKASVLLYSGTEEKLYLTARKLTLWSIYITLPAACTAISVILLTATSQYEFWLDRLLLLPLVIIPSLMIWMLAIPRLRRIKQSTGRRTTAPLTVRLRFRAAEPGLIVPFQLSALSSLTALFLSLSTTAPFQMLNAAIPLILLVLVSLTLWITHLNRSSRVSLEGVELKNRPWLRMLSRLTIVAVAAIIGSFPFYSAMQASRLPETLAMTTGSINYGNGTPIVHSHSDIENSVIPAMTTPSEVGAADKEISVQSLTGPVDGKPDVSYTLTAEKKTVRLSSGKTVDAWTYNGQIPGPELRMREGQLVEVRLINKDIESGVTLHWHGLDVPNAEDGVAGATQNAVMPGESHTYRFLAEQTGSFWYHSHQESKEAVQRGLFGSLVVEPRDGMPSDVKDISVITHVWRGAGFAIGNNDEIERMSIVPGTHVRLRITNTDDWVRQSYRLVGTKFQVAAIDGTELNEPGDLENISLDLITGGRYDVTFIMPETPVYLSVGQSKKLGIYMSRDGQGELPQRIPAMETFDPTHYGAAAPTPIDIHSTFDREFTMVLDNRMGFYNGAFGFYDTINDEVFPNTPMFMVREGEQVKTTIINRGPVDHPMHLHGHHMLVLSRNGEEVTGSPWWSDTLDVAPGETYEVAFIANNPGLWMDHCHNLQHAAAGMTMHLMYEGVTSPYEVGSSTVNHPE